jgi:hypothetical protein
MGLLSRLAVPQDAGWHNIDILYGRPICDSQGRVVKRQLPASVVSTGGHSSPLRAESVCDSKMKRIRSWAQIISQREKWFQDVVLIGRPKLFLRMSVAEHLLAIAPCPCRIRVPAPRERTFSEAMNTKSVFDRGK